MSLCISYCKTYGRIIETDFVGRYIFFVMFHVEQFDRLEDDILSFVHKEWFEELCGMSVFFLGEKQDISVFWRI